MKSVRASLFLAILLTGFFSGPAAAAEPYVWTSRDGAKSEAEFVALEDNVLVVQRVDRIIHLPLNAVAAADREYARTCSLQQKGANELPLQVFDGGSFSGRSSKLASHVIYSGRNIPQQLDRKIGSLILKKGYQVTIAVNQNGIGLSKVLIAARRDIRIPNLSDPFNDRIQFIRVVPWHNPVKKGHGGPDFQGLEEGWFYLWGGQAQPTQEIQWVPMAFHQRHTTNEEWIRNLIKRRGVQDVLGFNEPEHMPGGKAKNAFLISPTNSVQAMKPLMTTGLRIGSPNVTQSGPKKWLPEFMELARQQELRQDFVCIHWYDWGNQARIPDPDPQDVFERFKKHIKQVYSAYRLPIWITEFNANPYRNADVQLAFMKLALPWLDDCPYVERYAWFQPFGVEPDSDLDAEDVAAMDHSNGNGCFREIRGDINTPLTEIGQYWNNHASVPALSQDVYLGKNNLCLDEVE